MYTYIHNVINKENEKIQGSMLILKELIEPSLYNSFFNQYYDSLIYSSLYMLKRRIKLPLSAKTALLRSHFACFFADNMIYFQYEIFIGSGNGKKMEFVRAERSQLLRAR